MKIRRAKTNDLKWIHKMLNENYEFRNEDKGEEEYPMLWVKGVIESKKGNIVLIMEENEEAIGFLIIHIILGANDAIINNLYIKPEYRRKGFALSLLKEGERIAKVMGCKFVAASINNRNKNSQKFFSISKYRKANQFIVYWKWLNKE